MRRNILILFVVAALLVVAGSALAGSEESWTGWLTDTRCGAREDQAGHAECAKRCAQGGGEVALVGKEGKLFKLEPRDKVVENAGEYVTVTGTLEDGVIKVSSIKKAEKPSM